jgi:3-oxoacyl-[acyl-carrier protein] reductase
VFEFAKEGYGIIALGRDKERLEKVQLDALSVGAKACRVFSIDFQNLDEINSLFEKLIDIEHIDAIVNSAGIAYTSEIDNITISEWDEVMRVNVTAPFVVIQSALPWLLKSDSPSVVNISSIAGRTRSISLGCHYSTCKAAVIGMTRHLAAELGPIGIRVNCIAPSQTHSPMLDSALSKEGQEKLAETVPLKRLGTTEEQAEVIYFLCSRASSFINGATIDVNGGLL